MLTINVEQIKGFSETQIAKVGLSMAILERIFNAAEFRESILNFKYNGKYQFHFRKNIWGRWIDTYYPNEQVYERIMTATETAGNIKPGQVDLYLQLDPRKGGGVVGYGYPAQKEIYTYSDWFESFNTLGYAAHIAHEYCHKLGFTHSHAKNEARKYSVPYAIGYIVADLYKKLNLNY